MLDSPFTLANGTRLINRVVIQPMEGCDCNGDGSPGELTLAKYLKNARSGAGLVWFEANAVTPEGRTNPRQMMLTADNLDSFKALTEKVRETAYSLYGFSPVLLIQLTHSGRQSIRPMIAYRNEVYEKTRPLTDENIVTDEYLDTLAEKYANSARLAALAGFDGVDVKSCHGYLFQELLSAFRRGGRYGGDFSNRTKLLTDCFDAVKAAIPPSVTVGCRLGITDMVPYPNGFGTTADGEADLAEPLELIGLLEKRGLDILNVTVGNPYYNPHVNRPFRRGAYDPPESPQTGLKRFEDVESEIKRRFPELPLVASGMSYYRAELMDKAEELLARGVCDLVGFGRESLAYPSFYADYTAGRFDPKKCCAACSRCTELMRHKQVSGCAVFDPYYRELYKNTVK